MRKTIVGTGMMARVAEARGPADFPSFEAYMKALASDPINDAPRKIEAGRMLEILRAEVDWLSDDYSRTDLAYFWGTYPEDSGPSIAALWLSNLMRLDEHRTAILDGTADAETMENLLRAAEMLGTLRERLYWRAGLDYQTGKRREALALSGRKQTKAGKAGRDMRTDSSFASVYGEDAQAMADGVAARNPHLTWTAIRRQIASHYGVSPETVKKSLTNPKKAG